MRGTVTTNIPVVLNKVVQAYQVILKSLGQQLLIVPSAALGDVYTCLFIIIGREVSYAAHRAHSVAGAEVNAEISVF